jgi:cation diffusion facilitator CzcD-associated flavoprotein CzcO
MFLFSAFQRLLVLFQQSFLLLPGFPKKVFSSLVAGRTTPKQTHHLGFDATGFAFQNFPNLFIVWMLSIMAWTQTTVVINEFDRIKSTMKCC